MDVSGGRDREGNNVQAWRKNNSAAQKWTIVYQDKAGRSKSRGMNKRVGLEINRPFYIQSRMPMKRVVEAWGANWLVIRDYVKDKRGQQFFFDEKSKTIKSQQWQDRSIDIHSNGRNYHLKVSGTNSRWW
jgi:hypothetical protein